MKKYNWKNYNFKLVLMLLAITIIGIMVIGSAKESVQGKQIAGFGLGLFLMFFISVIDYSFVLKFQWTIYGFNIFLLLLVQIAGSSANNAQRWLMIGGIRFQPSELAKILLILFYAQFIIKHEEKLNTFSNLLKSVLFLLPPLLLVYMQPDLSTSIMIVVIFCAIIFVSGLSYKVIAGIFAVLVPAVLILLFIVLQPQQTVIKDYQQNRILAWINPDKYALTTAYQTQNSITAIGSGQLTGKGYKNDDPNSVKNGNYISEPQTDFIFAIIGEELGFVGGLTVILLLMLIALECYKVGRYAKDIGGRVICTGMGTLICFQTFINISVATGIIPNTGLPLPFVSYGLTSLVSLYIGMGFVLNVSLSRNRRISYD